MKTITIQGHIHYQHYEHNSWTDDRSLDFHFWKYEDMASQGYFYVCPYTVTFDVPEGWSPVPGQIAALEAQRAKVQKEFTDTVARINAEIGKLQAIEYEPEEVAP